MKSTFTNSTPRMKNVRLREDYTDCEEYKQNSNPYSAQQDSNAKLPPNFGSAAPQSSSLHPALLLAVSLKS